MKMVEITKNNKSTLAFPFAMTAISTARFLLRGKILFLNFFKPQSRHD
jgi:hypothetical protein